MLKKLFIYLFIGLLTACSGEDEREEEIAKIPVEMEVARFDQRFAEATAEDLPALKKDFPYLFPKQFPDSIWVQKMNDTIQLELDRAVAEEFPDFAQPSEELERLFQHIKFYFPQENIPKVVTLTTDVDYRNQVVWADSLMLVALDTYLGPENSLYVGVQEYIRKNFRQSQLVSDAATAFAETKVPQPRSRSFLAHMLYYGKMLYLKELLIPFKADAEILGYLPEEIEWAQANEEQIWRYFVQNELLFSSDPELYSRFLFPGPFSKFYLELDAEAPARLGQYIGWQILRQYMDKNEVSVEEMLTKSAEEIFNESNYKPKKNG